MTDAPMIAAARALYEQFVASDPANEYASWESLQDKGSWIDRAEVAVGAWCDASLNKSLAEVKARQKPPRSIADLNPDGDGPLPVYKSRV